MWKVEVTRLHGEAGMERRKPYAHAPAFTTGLSLDSACMAQSGLTDSIPSNQQ